jgi:subtilisin family serine protease
MLTVKTSTAVMVKDKPILYSPSAQPSGIQLAPGTTSVVFKAVVGGTSTRYPNLSLDEVFLKGAAKRVGSLTDNGQGVDENAGDFVYTGVLEISTEKPAERYFRVSTEGLGELLTSGTVTVGITSFPVVARDSDLKKRVRDLKTMYWLFSNEVIIILYPGVSADRKRIEVIEKAVNGEVMGVIPGLRKYLLEIKGDGSATGVYKVVEFLLKTFKDDVKNAYPNYLVVDQALPSETPSGCTNAASDCQWYIEHLAIDKVWDLAGGGSVSYPVAVVEQSGIKGSHADLANQCQAGWGSDPCPANPGYEHGTQVAGVLGAEANNGGIVGVAYGTKLFSYRFVNSTYSLSTAINNIDASKRIINLSLEVGDVIQTEITQAICRGALIVAAAGNVGPTCPANIDKYPAKYNYGSTTLNCPGKPSLTGKPLSKHILAVGATDIQNNLASWTGGCSNYASWIDIFAPGEDIYTTNISGAPPYVRANGTSLAAPIVSGAAAILWSFNSSWDAADIHDRIIDRATELNTSATCSPPCDLRFLTGETRMQGKKLINILASLGVPSNLSLSPSNPSVNEDCSDIAGSGYVVATVSAEDIDGAGETFSYTFVDDAGNPVMSSGPFQISTSGLITVNASCDLDYETASNHRITIRVTDSTNLIFQKDFFISVNKVGEAPKPPSSLRKISTRFPDTDSKQIS